MLTVSLPAWSQTVTFSGSISRHAESERTTEVTGTIYFHYSYDSQTDVSNDNTVSHQFTIPAGVNSVEYQQELEWSLAGSSIDSIEHDFFRISIVCDSNCESNNITNSPTWALENGTTGRAGEKSRSPGFVRIDPEEFGKDSRESSYDVELVLLPRYANSIGSVQLPGEQPAPKDITIELIGLDFGGCCYSNWARLFGQDLLLAAGQSEVSFEFKVDTERLSPTYRDNKFNFGYLCDSTACRDSQLVESVFVNIDNGQLQSITNRSFVGLEPIDIQMAWSSDTFRLELPKPIELLKTIDVPVNVSSFKQESLQADVRVKL